MKNVSRKSLVMLFITISLTGFAHNGGSGTRGGGHVIEVGGKLELVDLVTSATCDWYSGSDVIEANSELTSILKKIEKLDWYFANELKREIEYISWCMTGKLYSVSAVDEDTFVQQLSKGVQQAAFRYNDSAYIDQGKLSQLSLNSQAYLIIHEALHSYLPMELEMRKMKLMSLVSTIRKVDLGQIETRKALHFNFEKNELNFPLTVSKLDSSRKALELLLSSVTERAASILQTKTPEDVLNSKMPNLSDLTSWDQVVIANPKLALIEGIKEIFLSNNVTNIKKVLHEQKYSLINPVSIAITVMDQLSTEAQAEVLASKYLKMIPEMTINYLNSMSVKISDSRILANVQLQSLSGACAQQAQFLTSIFWGAMECGLPVEIESLGPFIVEFINEKKVLDENILNNAALISALKLESLYKSLDALDAPIEREKVSGKSMVETLRKEMIIKRLSNYIEQRVTAEEFETIKPFINKL